MRLRDLADWWRLRRHLARPWEFIRLRGRPGDGPFQEVKLRDGTAVRIRTGTLDRHILHRIFARDEYRVDELPAARPGEVTGAGAGAVIDIGAHIGLFALRAAPRAARVLSYEPDPGNFELLLENTRRFPHIVPRPYLVGGRSGMRTLHLRGDPAGHSVHAPSGHSPSRMAAGAALQVRCITLAEVFAGEGIERCILLKLDCEGAEEEVLAAAPSALWPRIERVSLEYHPLPAGADGSRPGRLASLLSDMGHRVEVHPSRRSAGRGRIYSRRRQ